MGTESMWLGDVGKCFTFHFCVPVHQIPSQFNENTFPSVSVITQLLQVFQTK